ncbi:type VII secretion integral membrane protein EccD [Nocardia terpenica]|uniref:type VII secretion integral membrane protein EccD n=1 Tax=Nocardia terpenica TaxID=455432 RepID=UPI002FE2923A
MTAQSISGASAVEPELCRVSVIGGNTQLDVGLPANVPIAAFIGELVTLIESRNPNPVDQEDGGAPLRPQHWALARLGRDIIAPNQTLADAEVFDGELLVLRSVTAKESPALFDDVIDAVSRLTAEEFRPWSPAAARWTGLVAAVLSVLVTIGVLAAARRHGDGLAAPIVLTGVALGALVAAAIAARRYADELTATVLGLCTVLLAFGAAALFVPGALGSAHLMFGFVAAGVFSIACYRATGAGPALVAATTTVSLIGAIAAAVQMVWSPGVPRIAAGVLVVAIVTISAVPRLAAVLARLPIPPVPTAGAAIDPADHEPRPTIEGIGAIGATVLPSAAGLGLRARLANQYQTGMLAGCALAAAFGAVAAADPLGAARWQGIVLAGITAVILSLRGRSFADLAQACMLIVGGATTLVALLALLALGDSVMVLPGAGLLLVFAAAAVGFGVIGPHVEVTPVTRRMNEIFEYALIVALIPLVLWLMDVYSMARNI